MTLTCTTIVKKDGDWWIGWIKEVPGVNVQERSKADLLRSLRLILREALEFNRAAALKGIGSRGGARTRRGEIGLRRGVGEALVGLCT